MRATKRVRAPGKCAALAAVRSLRCGWHAHHKHCRDPTLRLPLKTAHYRRCHRIIAAVRCEYGPLSVNDVWKTRSTCTGRDLCEWWAWQRGLAKGATVHLSQLCASGRAGWGCWHQ
jgi:hypothetical protein